MPTILYAASVAALILAPLAGVSILWAGALMLAGLCVDLIGEKDESQDK